MLYEDLAKGGVGLYATDVLNKVGCEAARLQDLFRDHPTWRALVVNAGGRGMYTLDLGQC